MLTSLVNLKNMGDYMSIKVTLLQHTPSPEQTIAMAAKLCYSASEIENIKDGLTPEKTESFLNMLTDLGHASPIEHASFTFGIEGISRACSHQLVRHRIASYSQQSQRYVDGNKFEYVTPPEIENCEKAKELYDKVIDDCSEAYCKVRDALASSYIKKYLGKDIDKTDSEIINEFKDENKAKCSEFIKKANEDARFILPNACTTKVICTFNTRSLLHFLELRCCNRAQWEIREVAEQMLNEVKKVAPVLFKDAGPQCVRGNCPEGKMSCGKMKEMREKYGC